MMLLFWQCEWCFSLDFGLEEIVIYSADGTEVGGGEEKPLS